MLADAVHRAHDEGYDSDLDAQEGGLQGRLLQVELLVKPCEGKDEEQPGQHEAEACEHASQPAALHHPEVDAELVRFRARQHLIDRQQAVEAGRGDPLLLLDQLALDHRDLRNRSAPGEKAEAKEARKDRQRCFARFPLAHRNTPRVYPRGTLHPSDSQISSRA